MNLSDLECNQVGAACSTAQGALYEDCVGTHQATCFETRPALLPLLQVPIPCRKLLALQEGLIMRS